MRCSLLALALALALAGCTPELCGRNSDCAAGLVCTAVGQCAPAPDASATSDGGGSAASDAGTDAEPVIEGKLR